MNDLQAFFETNTGRQIHKWPHYFDAYDRHFARFRGRRPVVVEIGAAQGGSLQMWRAYFGPGARIIGVDVDPRCKAFEEDGIEVRIGSQSDRAFLRQLVASLPPIDVLIDDGGHTMCQQRVTFEEVFPAVRPDGGVCVCEDTHTSYWLRYGGGYRQRGTFIEFAKGLVDHLHAWHSEQPRRLRVSAFTRGADSIHFYDGMVVIEKRPRSEPAALKTGAPTFDPAPPRRPLREAASRAKWALAWLLRALRLPLVIQPHD